MNDKEIVNFIIKCCVRDTKHIFSKRYAKTMKPSCLNHRNYMDIIFKSNELTRFFNQKLLKHNILWRGGRYGYLVDKIQYDELKAHPPPKATDYQMNLIHSFLDVFKTNGVDIRIMNMRNLSTRQQILNCFDELEMHEALEKKIILDNLKEN